jgi:GTPase
MESQEKSTFKSGYVAVMGRPNVGKSTLINALLGQKIAAVSPRPQTTRRRQLGILTLESGQIIFMDTPGVHKPRNKLGQSLNRLAEETLEETDLILFLVDASTEPNEEDRILSDMLASLKKLAPILLLLNKVDLIPRDELETKQAAYQSIMPEKAEISTMAISATSGIHMTDLLEKILSHMPEGEPFYPESQITDIYEREIAADLIRESALIHLKDEVPHGVSIRVDEYTERNEHGAYIAATVFVERESHKPILIGQGGEMLKKIGTFARQEIERMSGRKVFLQLRVKVRKNWRNDEKILRWFGY